MGYKLELKNKKEIEAIIKLLIYSRFNNSDKMKKFANRFLKRLNNLYEKKKIKVSSGKAKGRNLQKFVCNRLADIFNIKYDQQDDNCIIHSREMGQAGKDIIIRKPLYDKFNFDIECKNTESINLYKFIEQAKSNTEKEREWLLIHKKNYSEPVVCMSWDSFEKLLRR